MVQVYSCITSQYDFDWFYLAVMLRKCGVEPLHGFEQTQSYTLYEKACT